MLNLQLPTITMEDELGIVYVVETAQQFWSELEDILAASADIPTLQQLDGTLKRCISLCASYHQQYLQSPLQLEHACNLIIESDLFSFHSERMSDILVDDVKSNTDPHAQFIIYSVLLYHGRRRQESLKIQKRWKDLIPLLMDHILVDIDSDVEDSYFGTNGSQMGGSYLVPIEAKLRELSVRILYEICKVQRLSLQELRVFDDSFLDYLFELVEQTKHMHNETLNYSIIKLIVALNEKFMVATLSPNGDAHGHNGTDGSTETRNRVLNVLIHRLESSKTFGANMIFMLNRAQRTPEDQCMQLLVLKLLYLLFTTPGTSEYFYTNDLRVLVDVFLRELADLDDDSESLRHTYLRVLHPLMTKTQLREIPYKRPQIVYALESLLGNSRMRDVNATTKRLVQRCLGGEWCVHLRRVAKEPKDDDSVDSRLDTPSSASGRSHASTQLGITSVTASSHLSKPKTLKSSKSMEFIQVKGEAPSSPKSAHEGHRRHDHDAPGPLASSSSLPLARPTRKGTANSAHVDGAFADRIHPHTLSHRENELQLHEHRRPYAVSGNKAASPMKESSSSSSSSSSPRRSAPPPPKRRKPPAIPTSKSGSDITITAIRSSASSPLARLP